MPRTKNPIFAIGYSNRTVGGFIKVLNAHAVQTLIDIRTIPRSRHQPGFNESALRAKLKRHKIAYTRLKGLGGLRKPLKNSANMGWRNDSFRGYADYMQTRPFASSLLKLIKISKRRRVAIMCAEGNPFRCHRSLVADALLVRGVSVLHISSASPGKPHSLNVFAKVEGKRIKYPGKM